MKANMKKLTILGLPVTMFAAGLFAGAIMFGGSNSPTALKNVAHAQRPDDPTVEASVICTDTSTGSALEVTDVAQPVPKGVVTFSLTPSCPSGTTATGGGYVIRPTDDANARVSVTASFPVSASRWGVLAIR